MWLSLWAVGNIYSAVNGCLFCLAAVHGEVQYLSIKHSFGNKVCMEHSIQWDQQMTCVKTQLQRSLNCAESRAWNLNCPQYLHSSFTSHIPCLPCCDVISSYFQQLCARSHLNWRIYGERLTNGRLDALPQPCLPCKHSYQLKPLLVFSLFNVSHLNHDRYHCKKMSV